MVAVGDEAPDFTVPIARGNGTVEAFTLSEALGDGPLVLAFFPAAFTGGCTTEMCTFRDSMAAFEDLDASVYGVSVDLPFALNEFIDQQELNFPMLSDASHRLIADYGVELAGLDGLVRLAERSVFVIDDDGVVTYRWVRVDGQNPDFEELVEEVRTAAAEAASPA